MNFLTAHSKQKDSSNKFIWSSEAFFKIDNGVKKGDEAIKFHELVSGYKIERKGQV